MMLSLFGCGGAKFKVDYNGQKDSYTGAKDYYRSGEKVTVYYGFIATDTDYSFYLDGERINTGYDEKKGFVISFTMPDHDVTLVCESRNSMVYVPPIEPGTMLVDYYRATVATVGGDGYDEMVLSYYDETQASLDVYRLYEPDEKETCVSYLVPYEAVDRCYEAIDEEDFRSWEGRDDLTAITGAVIVCKFREGDGEYTRVSSENMPEDGQRSMGRIAAIMNEYRKEEYLK